MRGARLAALVLLSLPLSGGAHAACLKAGAENQVAEGQLAIVRITIPDYKRTEQVFMLQLAAPACLDVADKEDEVEPTKKIHLFGDDDATNKRMRGMAGKAVRVKGEPFAQHTAHHHAPIVMRVTAIEVLPK